MTLAEGGMLPHDLMIPNVIYNTWDFICKNPLRTVFKEALIYTEFIFSLREQCGIILNNISRLELSRPGMNFSPTTE